MDKFEKWLEVINEELNPTPTVSEPIASVEPTVSSDVNIETGNRTDMISDIDHIMTSLETLAGELTEDLSLNEDSLDVAGAAALGGIAALGVGAKKFYDWKVTAPKARKAQAKVNAMGVKIAGVKNSIASAEAGKKKDAMSAKLEVAKETMTSLQTQVDDKYGKKGSVVKNALSAEKKAGKMEILKITLGEASPSQKKAIKDQINKLKLAVAEDEREYNDSKPGKEDEAELQKAVDKEQKGKKEDVPDADKNKEKSKADKISALKQARKPLITGAGKDEDPVKNATARLKIAEINLKIAGLEGEDEEGAKKDLSDAKQKLTKVTLKAKKADKDADAAAGKDKKVSGETDSTDKKKAFDDQIESLTKKIKNAEEKLETGESDGKEIPDSAKEGIKKSIESLKSKVEDFKKKKSELGESFDTVMLDMKALEEQIDTLISEMFTNINEENKEKSQKESLIYRALKVGNDLLAEEIAGKSSWQLHNTKLYTKYNSIITKLESDQMVSEGLSIRDKFSKLI